MVGARGVGILGAVVCIGAGAYLLTIQSAAEGTTIFEAIAHGMGAYFIGKGLFVGAMAVIQTDSRDFLRQLVEFCRAAPRAGAARIGWLRGATSGGVVASHHPWRTSPGERTRPTNSSQELDPDRNSSSSSTGGDEGRVGDFAVFLGCEP